MGGVARRARLAAPLYWGCFGGVGPGSYAFPRPAGERCVGMRKTLLLPALAVLAALLAAGAASVVAGGPAGAAFPGANGKIAFSYGDIYTVDPDGTDRRNLSGRGIRGEKPAWAPGGKRLAFDVNGGGDDIWVMKADGSEKRNLTRTDGLKEQEPAWAPGGGRIAFVLEGGPRVGDIWTMKADGSDRRRFTESAEDESGPAWSPDGDRIAFERGGDIYVKEIGAPDAVPLTAASENASPTVDAAPDWSPDGGRVAFSRYRNGDSDPGADVYVVRAPSGGGDAGPPRRLVADGSDPAFSPGGGRVAFQRYAGSGFKIFIAGADGSGPRRVPTGLPGNLDPAWQPLP